MSKIVYTVLLVLVTLAAALQALKVQGAGLSRWNRQKLSRSVIVKMADMPICRQ